MNMQSKLLCASCNIAVDFCDWHPRNSTPGIHGSDPGCSLDFVLLTIIEQLVHYCDINVSKHWDSLILTCNYVCQLSVWKVGV